ncbi:MAG: hemolysin family protein [Cyanobacteriota bacterium]|nr:hemolysin family protein [Cyanobacteriota bacterium]
MTLLLVVLLAFSAAFSAAETAITALDNLRLEALIAETGDPQGIYRLVQQHRSRFITTLLLGNNLVNIGSAALTTTLFIQLLGQELGGLIATVPTTILILLFGEVTPKSLAFSHPLRVFMLLIRPVYWLSRLLYPVVLAFEWVLTQIYRGLQVNPLTAGASLQDLETLIDMLGQRGLLDWQKRRLFRGALSLDQVMAKDVAKPRVKMETTLHSKTLRDVVDLCLATGYSRIPVQADSKDEIVGIIHLKQALRHLEEKGNDQIDAVMRPPVFVPATKRIGPLLKDMLRSRQHMAIVVDEFGGTTGLITLEDLLEELVGDIFDESDLNPLQQRSSRAVTD